MIWNPALKNVLTYLGSADLQSAAKEYAFPFIGGITNPQVFIGRTFFTADFKSAGTPGGFNRGISLNFVLFFPYFPIADGSLSAIIINANLKQTLAIGRIWNQIALFIYLPDCFLGRAIILQLEYKYGIRHIHHGISPAYRTILPTLMCAPIRLKIR